jgi:hypothetical protein
MQPPLRSRTLYVDATPTSMAAYFVGPPLRTYQCFYTDNKPIAWAEMVAALAGLIWLQAEILDQAKHKKYHHK